MKRSEESVEKWDSKKNVQEAERWRLLDWQVHRGVMLEQKHGGGLRMS